MAKTGIHINALQLAKLEVTLFHIQDGSRKAMNNAINRSLPGVMTDASRKIREKVTITDKGAKKAMKIQKSDVAKLGGKFVTFGGMIPLTEYSVNQTKKGLSVRVRKDKPRYLIEGAFLATMKSGHKWAGWRAYKPEQKRPVRQLRYGRLPKKYRLPLSKELFGPRVPDVMGNDDVMNPVLAKAQERLDKNLESQVDWLLSK